MRGRAQFEMQEKRLKIFERDKWRCRTCGQSIHRHGTPQVAHRIAQSDTNYIRFGAEIVDHRMNMASVCCGTCNDAQNIGNKGLEAERLAVLIQEAIDKEREACRSTSLAR